MSSNIPSSVIHTKRATQTFFSSTDRPPHMLIVRQINPQESDFKTISDAVNALKALEGPVNIFIHPGVYHQQVHIKYKYPLRIQGYTSTPGSAAANKVTVQVAVSAASRGGRTAQSSAIWVKSPRFEMLNVNVVNSFGKGTDKQAVALTAQGEKHVYKFCHFSGYQDTLLIKTMSSYFFGCRIEGAVDFILGGGTAWIQSSDILVRRPTKSYATITAQRRLPGQRTRFVFNKCEVLPYSPATLPNSTYLGRPWSSYAAVTFQYSYLSNIVNPLGWIAWNRASDEQKELVSYQEFKNYGPGSPTRKRQLGTVRSQPLQIADVLGSDYATWVR
ncbi:hypothetical protein PCANC_08607 [Puccinia coronata f. sp. avenae]|uniref:pectinesterase n=1 Tax=Puccinia coronata f. sp. avenae TaxID=200324 RepID=A0A2N5S1J4_9BASI|nr:hypothetical protein PCANC_21825 [Puccinia coronata f. sp. avenae]PLW23065.1 hypothetical protein PCASD_11045 [Puccinia coronata f. sp. avenae]PLW42539.1 hypothetical protein PCANC_08607 [Puccinia coronata f. sp. avenae]